MVGFPERNTRCSYCATFYIPYMYGTTFMDWNFLLPNYFKFKVGRFFYVLLSPVAFLALLCITHV